MGSGPFSDMQLANDIGKKQEKILSALSSQGSSQDRGPGVK